MLFPKSIENEKHCKSFYNLGLHSAILPQNQDHASDGSRHLPKTIAELHLLIELCRLRSHKSF